MSKPKKRSKLKYKWTNVTAKTGLNFVRSVVEGEGSLFHKVEQESDLGIDAFLELIKDESPLNVLIAAQIKSGRSYFDKLTGECRLPIKNHRDYWANYRLPVIGVVYLPELLRAHWVDIQNYLKEFPQATVIRFKPTEANRIDSSTFQARFIPIQLNKVPEMPLREALTLLKSSHYDEALMGIVVLFRKYPNSKETWEALVDYFVQQEVSTIPPVLIYYLAHIPWHGDIGYTGEPIRSEAKEFATQLLVKFGQNEVLKLLGFIDPENGISRGTLGQSVEAIISLLPNADGFLKSIALDESVQLFNRECAGLILAMYEGKLAIPALTSVANSGSWYAEELIKYLQIHGAFDPY